MRRLASEWLLDGYPLDRQTLRERSLSAYATSSSGVLTSTRARPGRPADFIDHCVDHDRRRCRAAQNGGDLRRAMHRSPQRSFEATQNILDGQAQRCLSRWHIVQTQGSGAVASLLVSGLRISVSAASLVLPVLQELRMQLGDDVCCPDAARVIHDANARADPNQLSTVKCTELSRYPAHQEPKAFPCVGEPPQPDGP